MPIILDLLTIDRLKDIAPLNPGLIGRPIGQNQTRFNPAR